MVPCCCCRRSAAFFGGLGLLLLLAVLWLVLSAGSATSTAPLKSAPAVIDAARGQGKQDWTMFGGTPARNLVNTTAKNVLTVWDIEKKINVKWQADIGNRGYMPAVVANGKVYVATSNARPRDPKITTAKAILMCFSEAKGEFLWQAVHDMPPDKIADMAVPDGLCSTPAIDGDRIYYLAPACELVCADAATGKEHWKLELMKQPYGVYPCFIASGSPLVVGDLVFAVTGNGNDAATGKQMYPEAPSFVAVDKMNGKVKWSSNLPGKNIIEGQWSNPVWAEVNGKPQVIFPGGDCVLYSFEPDSGKLLWKFNCSIASEAAAAKKIDKTPSYIVATPVVHEEKLYIGTGVYPGHHDPAKVGHFWCIDLVKATANAAKNKDLDVSPVKENLDPKAAENKDSALAWHYGGKLKDPPKFGRSVVFGGTASTAAVQGGLVYISEEAGFLHCLDASTGQKYWEHDLLTSVSASPFWVDNKVFMGTDDGEVLIFEHGKQKNLLATVEMDRGIQSPPVIANGTLFVVDAMKVYAIGK